MKITPDHVPFPHIIVDDFLPLNIVDNILNELESLQYTTPDKTGSAQDPEGNYLKNNKGVFLDEIYKDNRHKSIILTEYHKALYDPYILAAAKTFNLLFKYYTLTNFDTTLVSYYENSNYYKEHTDDSLFTALYYVHKQPRKYYGGEIVFNYRGVEYSPATDNNRLIIFPAIVKHRVEPVSIDPEYANNGYGRYCISTFMWKNGNL